MAQSATLPAEPGGSIRADELLTLRAVQDRLGLGIHAMRTARRRGLPVRRIGKRSYVLGRDVLEYVEKTGRVVGQ